MKTYKLNKLIDVVHAKDYSEADAVQKELALLKVSCNSANRTEILQIHEAIEKAESGEGVLVLTDLMGASPSNRVAVLLEHYNAVMVTGVNLAMLLCVWANSGMPLGQLARKAADCGRRSVKIFQE